MFLGDSKKLKVEFHTALDFGDSKKLKVECHKALENTMRIIFHPFVVWNGDKFPSILIARPILDIITSDSKFCTNLDDNLKLADLLLCSWRQLFGHGLGCYVIR